MGPNSSTLLHVVLTHSDGRRVAAVDGALPRAEVAGAALVGGGLTGALPAISPWLAPVRRLHHARRPGGAEDQWAHEAVWHLESLAPVSGVTWVRPDALPEPEARWARAALLPAPARRPPYARPGWSAATLAWLDEELGEQGLSRAGMPEPLRHWGISALWRVPLAEGGAVYLKAVPAFFAREVKATCLLSREVAGAAAPVLAADESRNLLLLGHAGEEPGEDEDGAGLSAHLARVQRASVAALPGLRSRGVPEHGPEWVAACLPELLRDDVLLVGEPEGLSPDEAARLRALEPELREACARLSASPLPAVAAHGDLHRGNAVRDAAGRWTLLDWSDASVTHPFLDADPAYLAPEDAGPGTLAAVREAYLAGWADVLPPSEGRALLEDARLVGEMYRALGYTHGLHLHVEDEAEWRGAHLHHLRRVVRRAQPVPT